MLSRFAAVLLLLFLPHGCSAPGSPQPVRLKHPATGKTPEILALYEGWFGSPKHISVGYSSHDAGVVRRQIHDAKAMGISAFVVDWYGDRDPYIDQSYALVQATAKRRKFHVAMMYEETTEDNAATDEVIADLTMFHDTYLSAKSPGHETYLTYEGRPVIFIFPQGVNTDWDKVRAAVNKWNPAPLLIDESLPKEHVNAFDGYYAWINPGPQGWKPDGSGWGEGYLETFYQTLLTKFPDKIVVGGAWPGFDDSKASWSLNRHMSARCGQTFRDTFNFWRKYVVPDQAIPFMMIETWNDHEEGSAIENGIPTCGDQPQPLPLNNPQATAAAPPAK